jgi:hypothetical protein
LAPSRSSSCAIDFVIAGRRVTAGQPRRRTPFPRPLRRSPLPPFCPCGFSFDRRHSIRDLLRPAVHTAPPIPLRNERYASRMTTPWRAETYIGGASGCNGAASHQHSLEQYHDTAGKTRRIQSGIRSREAAYNVRPSVAESGRKDHQYSSNTLLYIENTGLVRISAAK